MNRILNWKPSPKDERDYKFRNSFKILSKEDLPSNASVNDLIPEVYDQLDIGSCCFNSTGTAILYNSRQQNREIFPSRLFHYYITRDYEGSIDCDCGAYIRDTFKTLNKTGVCKETTWPYVTSKFMDKPSQQSYNEAPQTVGVKYHALDNTNLNELKSCIANLKKPFVVGFWVYDSFLDEWEEIMPIPKADEKFLGGHAVLAVSYDDDRKAFLIKNSWGENWKPSLKGHFWMPYEFITSNECDDFWVLESINEFTPPEPTPNPPAPTSVIDAKIFTRADLTSMRESIVVKIGQSLGLDTDVKLSKKTNVNIVCEFLKI